MVAPSSTIVRTESRIEFRSKHQATRDGGTEPSYIDLSLFTNKYGKTPFQTNTGPFSDPRKDSSQKDYAVNTYHGTHGGSHWKLYNKKGNPVGTYDKTGVYMRP